MKKILFLFGLASILAINLKFSGDSVMNDKLTLSSLVTLQSANAESGGIMCYESASYQPGSGSWLCHPDGCFWDDDFRGTTAYSCN
ncbi:hypothetical protein [Flavivirga algicola]|uniref:Secreted protein n=1 Tax=Flavivirga algicola TaxID=2729136 RepID=A0ABX1RVG2_9FLAO|nr:hypothetical protein [Flavivirga algicola]NMH87539.1 hypothetical protein [Flavivirga algicola]